MRIIAASIGADGLVMTTTDGRLALRPITERIVRVVYTRESAFAARAGFAVVSELPPPPRFSVHETDDEISLETDALRVTIRRDSGALAYFDRDGALLLREPARGGKRLARPEGSRAYRAKLALEWTGGEALYGLGSHEEPFLNLRGHHQYLYQQNLKAVVPILVSTKGYALLFDCVSFMTFHDDAYGSYVWADAVDELDFYFVHGARLDEIVRGLRTLTGRAPMLPRWAFGYAQSKERYRTQEELLDVVREYRRRRIPLDLIVLDWMSWTGELWGQKSFDPERFPSPEAMIREIHALGARFMISVWPNMAAGGANHDEMARGGFLLGNEQTYDAFNPDARRLYWKQANEGLFSKGVDAWWCDCSEPFEADWSGELKPEPEERVAINTLEAKRYLDSRNANAYSIEHARGIYEGQRRATDEKRVMNLTRSSFAGQHRYATVTWSGDVSATWETLRRQIPAALNFCVTGEPYWTTDIGAFFVRRKPELWFWNGDYDGGCEDLGYRELYVRWFQLGAFLPMFRSHGTDTPREVWRFGEPGSMFYDALVAFITLRYRLLPYIYSLAAQVTFADSTMIRLLAFDFPDDERARDIADEYLFGPALLVCPVTFPLYYEAGSTPLADAPKVRPVYLPSGCDWIDFWTGERHSGGSTIEARATLDTMPLFVRAGSILPLGPAVQHSGETAGAPIELRIYAGADGELLLYDDEGDGYGYERGERSVTRIAWLDSAGRLTFDERRGSFPAMPAERSFHPVRVGPGVACGIDGGSVRASGVRYTGAAATVTVPSR